jgi:hypothetical protein
MSLGIEWGVAPGAGSARTKGEAFRFNSGLPARRNHASHPAAEPVLKLAAEPVPKLAAKPHLDA